MVHGGSLARALLPVQQRVAFLQDKVQVVFLERGKLAGLAVLVDECTPVQVFFQPVIFFHFREQPVLHFVLSPLASDQFLRRTDLTHVLFCRHFRHGQFGTFQHEVVDTRRLVRNFVKESRGILFQFEAV